MGADALGDRKKLYERLAERAAMPGLPLLARLDGRAFHTFTRNLNRPYDERLSRLMVETTQSLVQEFAALVGYTQSDEVSLLWHQHRPETELPFGGRAQKLASVLAASATAFFVRRLAEALPEKAEALPVFDGRVWSVPSREEAANYFLWRERDATKNSVAMAAQALYSHRQLDGKHSAELQELLWQKGVNWTDYPDFFKRGTFVHKRAFLRPFTPEELDRLPPKHHARTDPGLVVERYLVEPVNCPPLSAVTNRVEFLFEGREPVTPGEAA